MALLRGLSIKWKLSLALILSGLTLVGSYVLIAKNVFESDKISYVFDSQSSKLDSLKREIELRIERALLVSRSVIATYDASTGKISQAGEKILADEQNLLALELWNERDSVTVVRVEKQPSLLPASGSASGTSEIGTLSMNQLSDKKLLLSHRSSQNDGAVFRLQLVFDISQVLPAGSPSQSLALALAENVIAHSDFSGLEVADFQGVLSSLGKAGPEKTLIWKKDKSKFLVTEKILKFGGLRLISATPEAEALGALDTLFKRSIIFVIFSAFGLVLISLVLASQMTKGLSLLTSAAGEIGRGNFDSVPKSTSQDEIGVLSRAFQRMAEEIKALLQKTKENARMEQELKTASLIQERLLPHKPVAKIGDMEISGVIRTSSECGGDWWYYHVRGDDLYIAIADATGHGTPAALITAAATSIFARLEDEEISLTEMMRAWDKSINKCSGQQVFMTGVLMRINTKTGNAAYMSAAHEAPFLFVEEEDFSFKCEDLDFPTSPRLGSLFKSLPEEVKFELKPNCSILLYTDGLFAIEKPDGKNLNERRFRKQLSSKLERTRSADGITKLVLSMFDEHRESQPLPDDISVVSIRRQGPSHEPTLGSESGDLEYKKT